MLEWRGVAGTRRGTTPRGRPEKKLPGVRVEAVAAKGRDKGRETAGVMGQLWGSGAPSTGQQGQ